ncbi:D-2-hydroxyacid dehydrogenase [Colwellia sp. M166]|uniref:D-2-hydroxyacid dehydrogenase n=1 Tax=Colwellia sp. M166 TaxID=2583805 RepID=UPI00211E9B9B|nr:D-2-hydroxyacid dehydrogenase [Colwellia sp. M166]UUO24557.1 D-2-hydroxyacid dehydrogenase [Colwellia sp. M166]|tara:strand:- start:4383 stop:5336 length:954 start_codon:yes stop_codon:yes gene_type:complete
MRAVFLDYQTFSQSLDLSTINQVVSNLNLHATTSPSQVVQHSANAEIILTNKVELSRETLSQLPDLKLICVTATGINNVDIAAAKALGIAVTNVSGYAKNTLVQYIFAQLLAHFSQIEHHNRNTQQGLWQKSETFCLHGNGSIELAGKSIAIIGYGALGQKVADIAKAFDMTVLIAERPGATTIRPERMAFLAAIEQADIISLHCPQTPETQGMFNAELFARMKTSAILINTARGALINNQDLLSALNNDEIACAILDVLEQEPPPKDHILLAAQSPKLKITAHIAWASQQAQQALLNLVARNITAFKQGEHTNRVD